MITLANAKRIVELNELLREIKISMRHLDNLNVTQGILTLSGVQNGYSETGKFPISVKPAVARGLVRAALQQSLDAALRELRQMDAEVP